MDEIKPNTTKGDRHQ